MKMILLPVVLIAALALTTTCCNNTTPTQPSTPSSGPSSVVLDSLTATSTSISYGATTKITAYATGQQLSYAWSATAGDILGSGRQITYAASTCCGGNNTITCKVTDGSGAWKSQTITITVQ